MKVSVVVFFVPKPDKFAYIQDHPQLSLNLYQVFVRLEFIKDITNNSNIQVYSYQTCSKGKAYCGNYGCIAYVIGKFAKQI